LEYEGLQPAPLAEPAAEPRATLLHDASSHGAGGSGARKLSANCIASLMLSTHAADNRSIMISSLVMLITLTFWIGKCA
jgi:hypothetical protein